MVVSVLMCARRGVCPLQNVFILSVQSGVRAGRADSRNRGGVNAKKKGSPHENQRLPIFSSEVLYPN